MLPDEEVEYAYSSTHGCMMPISDEGLLNIKKIEGDLDWKDFVDESADFSQLGVQPYASAKIICKGLHGGYQMGTGSLCQIDGIVYVLTTASNVVCTSPITNEKKVLPGIQAIIRPYGG